MEETHRARQCRLCGAQTARVQLVLHDAPRDIQTLLLPDAQDQLNHHVDLRVYECSACGFVQLLDKMPETYYDEYLMGTSFSEQMQIYQTEQASQFIKTAGLERKRVLEVGCGDGSYLETLATLGVDAVGVEPSARFREEALARGLRVHGVYMTPTTEIPEAPFDAFVSRQVLEHIPDLHDFLLSIRRHLRHDAYGLIEVPSLETAIADRRFYDFFPDHVNYFSMATLSLLLQLNGFEVLDLSFGMGKEYLVATVRIAQRASVNEIGASIESIGFALNTYISQHHARGGKVAIWGAGGKGLSLMAVTGCRDFDLLVDSDPHKVGRITPIGRIPIQAPRAIADEGVAAVLVTALAYKNEIVDVLKNNLGFRGEIATLGAPIEIVKAAEQ